MRWVGYVGNYTRNDRRVKLWESNRWGTNTNAAGATDAGVRGVATSEGCQRFHWISMNFFWLCSGGSGVHVLASVSSTTGFLVSSLVCDYDGDSKKLSRNGIYRRISDEDK